MHQLPQDFSFEDTAKNIEHLIMYDITLTPSYFSKHMIPNYKLKCLEILRCKTSVVNFFSQMHKLFPAISSLSLVDNSYKLKHSEVMPKFSTVQTLHIDTPWIMYFKDKSGKFEWSFFKHFPNITHLKANLKHRNNASIAYISSTKNTISKLAKFISTSKTSIDKLTIFKTPKCKYTHSSHNSMTKWLFELEYDTHTPLIQY